MMKLMREISRKPIRLDGFKPCPKERLAIAFVYETEIFENAKKNASEKIFSEKGIRKRLSASREYL